MRHGPAHVVERLAASRERDDGRTGAAAATAPIRRPHASPAPPGSSVWPRLGDLRRELSRSQSPALPTIRASLQEWPYYLESTASVITYRGQTVLWSRLGILGREHRVARSSVVGGTEAPCCFPPPVICQRPIMLRKLVAAILPLHRLHSRDEVADGLPGARAELLLEALAALLGEANVVGGGHEKKILGVVADRGEDVVGLEEAGVDELPDGLALPAFLDFLPMDVIVVPVCRPRTCKTSARRACAHVN